MISAADGFAPLRAALERAGYGTQSGVCGPADFTPENLDQFLSCLPPTFYADAGEASTAILLGKPFNVIYMPMAFKFDLFPAGAFPLGIAELDRAVFLEGSGLSESTAPFVIPEDIRLAKLHWFRMGGEVSEVQWRDVQGIVRGRGATLDREYLEEGARKLGILPLLARALTGA
jgi:hypothetical protein